MNKNQITVLFVDNESDVLRALKRSLSKEPYRKIFADSAGRALNVMEHESPQVVVCCLDLPGIEGVELLSKARSHSPDIICVATSGQPDIDQLIACINVCGIFRFLVKPFDFDGLKETLTEAVEICLEKQEQNQQLKSLTLHYKRIKEILEKQQLTTVELLRASSLDIQTTIPNRTRFDTLINQEWRQARNNRYPLSLMLIDIDDHDRLKVDKGQAALENCLQKIAWTLRKTLRRSVDSIARFDEDTFAVLLPGTGSQGSQKVAQRILGKIQILEFELPEERSKKTLSVSIGMACKVPTLKPLPLQKFVSTAKMALYAAQKSGGRQWIDMSGELES